LRGIPRAAGIEYMARKTVEFRGREMAEGWPERILEAQRKTTCRRDGKDIDRVRYGDEQDDWGADKHPCGDCGAVKSEFHVPGCDVERCPSCQGQMINCECSSSKRSTKRAKQFSDKELEIVAARNLFVWQHIGFSNSGNAIFEVTNGSKIRLPFLSIGVQGRGGTKLIGGAWLDVSGIESGFTGVAEHDCYKDQLRPEEMEFFATPDPTPETRDRFWEFNRLSKKASPRK
jgi:hypothetical protein